MMVWGQYELVAIVGVGSTFYTVSMARGLANDLADALKQIHETDVLRQELAAYRHITAHWVEPILVVRSNGNIQLGTEAGWDALHAALHRRPTKKNPVSHLPPAMTAALGKPGKTTIGKVTMTVGLLPGEAETLSPLNTVLLMASSEIAGLNAEQKIQTLTPTQKAVYRLMLAGRRNKEIAAELGIAYNTVIKHASAVLAKMGFMDRLQLLTVAVQSEPRELHRAPQVLDAPVMPDLQVRVPSQKTG
jgi:DNA-binding CsgD family transcriptional regulator